MHRSTQEGFLEAETFDLLTYERDQAMAEVERLWQVIEDEHGVAGHYVRKLERVADIAMLLFVDAGGSKEVVLEALDRALDALKELK